MLDNVFIYNYINFSFMLKCNNYMKYLVLIFDKTQ